MIHFHRSCAVFAVVLLVPGTASAQREHAVGKVLANSAASELRPDERVARLAGPDWILRLAEDVRRGHARERFNVVHKNAQRDPVRNGVGVGALAGALGGAGLTAIMTTQCDGRCDDPSLSTVLLSTMAVGAGVGALIGFVIDRAR
jgi:hypothetical protein